LHKKKGKKVHETLKIFYYEKTYKRRDEKMKDLMDLKDSFLQIAKAIYRA
jgi:hypothetical protein